MIVALCFEPPWNPAKKPRSFRKARACISSRMPGGRSFTLARRATCAAACAPTSSSRAGSMPRRDRWPARLPIWRRLSWAMSAKRWRSNTILSNSIVRNSTSCFATTRPIPISNSRRQKNIHGCTSRGASRKMGHSISDRIFLRAWRAAFCILFTSGSWFLPARSI